MIPAQRILFDNFLPRVSLIARSVSRRTTVDREELEQEGAIALMEAARSFRGDVPFDSVAHRRVACSMYSYARQVTHYHAQDKIEFTLDEEAMFDVASTAMSPHERLEDKESLARLTALDDRERLVLIRRGLGHSNEDIAEDIGLTPQRVGQIAASAVEKYLTK